MKLFDYKFLILLALTLVVYFIFREVLDLRKKIDKLQSNIDEIKLIENSKKDNNVKDNVTSNKDCENKPNVGFQIPLPKKKIENVEKTLPPAIPKLMHNKLSTVEEKENEEKSNKISETESDIDTNNEERLAIYSNDNPDAVEDYSLDETSEINTQDIINNLSDNEIDNSEETTSPKKKNLLVEIEGDELKDTSTTDNIVLDNNGIESTEPKYTVSSLMRLKLNELQCLAEENSIEINHSEKNRRKTKTELSNDLIGHFKSA